MGPIKLTILGAAVFGLGTAAFAETYHRRELRIPAGSAELEAVIVRLDEPGRRPPMARHAMQRCEPT